MRSSVGSIEEFKESIIWLDIIDEIDVWLGQLHEMLENHGGGATHMMLDRMGGSCEALRNFKDILNTLQLVSDDESGRDAILNNLSKGGQDG